MFPRTKQYILVTQTDFKEARREGKTAMYRKTPLTEAIEMHVPFKVNTREGTMIGRKGDFLAIDVRGNLYPIGRAIFEQTYEVVE